MLTTKLRKHESFTIHLPDGGQVVVTKGVNNKLHVDSPKNVRIVFGNASNMEVSEAQDRAKLSDSNRGPVKCPIDSTQTPLRT